MALHGDEIIVAVVTKLSADVIYPDETDASMTRFRQQIIVTRAVIFLCKKIVNRSVHILKNKAKL